MTNSSGKVGQVMMDHESLIAALTTIRDSVNSHYQFPVIAPNGKAEGLCLSVRGLTGIIKKLMAEAKNV